MGDMPGRARRCQCIVLNIVLNIVLPAQYVFLQVLVAKMIASKFNRESHVKKMRAALKKARPDAGASCQAFLPHDATGTPRQPTSMGERLPATELPCPAARLLLCRSTTCTCCCSRASVPTGA